jgi:hypothetical protein
MTRILSDSQVTRKLNKAIARTVFRTSSDPINALLGATDIAAVLLDVVDLESVELPVVRPPPLPVVELPAITLEAAALSLAVTPALVYPDGQ